MAQRKTDRTNMKLRMVRVTSLFYVYEQLHDKLAVLDSTNDGLRQLTEIQDDYYELAAVVENILGATRLVEATGETTMIGRQRLLKLPVAELPKFNGDRSKWLTFKNTFMSMVDRRSDIDDLTKFLHLRNSLKGKAANKLSLYHASAEGYRTAWVLLTDAYERKRLLVSRHSDAILDIEALKKEASEGLAKIIDEVRQHLSMLKSLDVTLDERVIVRILERALPGGERERWKESLDLDSLPSFDSFCKFINETSHRLLALEHDNARSKGEKRPNERESQTAKMRKSANGARTFVSTPLANCVQCNDKHIIYKCPSFEKMTTQQRWDFVKAKHLCQNCLRTHAGVCPTARRCKKCRSYHHTLVHSGTSKSWTSRFTPRGSDNNKSTQAKAHRHDWA
ncbi:uncharacterized protein LOC124309431 [Neodiprion virginianus]|uniref:uncharacterized protein LOC124309431 n=1 Tax=Neodiprion virginianus TaxID=2961670 RepID=UPI001EE73836|nr:uncharacterized protein LOC124309431 [Neodiprion virginianus]